MNKYGKTGRMVWLTEGLVDWLMNERWVLIDEPTPTILCRTLKVSYLRLRSSAGLPRWECQRRRGRILGKGAPRWRCHFRCNRELLGCHRRRKQEMHDHCPLKWDGWWQLMNDLMNELMNDLMNDEHPFLPVLWPVLYCIFIITLISLRHSRPNIHFLYFIRTKFGSVTT